MTSLQKSDFVPSHYQAQVFTWARSGKADAVIKAVAGSGKTRTLKELGFILCEDPALAIMAIAFNNHSVNALVEAFKGTSVVAKTLHSVGRGAIVQTWGNPKLDEDKYRKLIRNLTDRQKDMTFERKVEVGSALEKMTNLVRCTLTNPHDAVALVALCGHHNIELDEFVIAHVGDLIDGGNLKALKAPHIIDFTDMVYLPWRYDMDVVQKADWVLVDEAQDLNKAQRLLAFKLRKPNGRMIFVGDPRQAIYGFAGADAESFEAIQEETGAIILPLSICYRCPSSVLDLARRIVPEIEDRSNAPKGLVEYHRPEDLHKLVRSGDLILCRMTAPLLVEAIHLIRRKIPAQVRGRDIGKDLTLTLDKIASRAGGDFKYEDLEELIEDWADEQEHMLMRRHAEETQFKMLADKVECLIVCLSNFPEAHSIKQLDAEIDALFADKEKVVWLSTVHRAKGLENPRVFIIAPEKLPLVWNGQLPWQATQERNLQYVACTRALEELHVMGEGPWPLLPAIYDAGINEDDFEALADLLSEDDGPDVITETSIIRDDGLIEHYRDGVLYETLKRVVDDETDEVDLVPLQFLDKNIAAAKEWQGESLEIVRVDTPQDTPQRDSSALRVNVPVDAVPTKTDLSTHQQHPVHKPDEANTRPVIYTDEHPLIHPPGFKLPMKTQDPSQPDPFGRKGLSIVTKEKTSIKDGEIKFAQMSIESLVTWLGTNLTRQQMTALTAAAKNDPTLSALVEALKKRDKKPIRK